MLENDNFLSFPLRGSIKTIQGNIEKPLPFPDIPSVHVSYRAEFETVIFHFQCKKFSGKCYGKQKQVLVIFILFGGPL